MIELERELTYLAKYLPDTLEQNTSEIIRDVYVPESSDHAILRLRHKGETYCITKKEPVQGDDSSRQNEHTIWLSKQEYDALSSCSQKQLVKRRYYVTIEGHAAEIDVYQESLAGLVVIDFEFATDKAMQDFSPPDICLADVTQDALIAAGKLAGKTYAAIQPELEAYDYKPLYIQKEQS